MKTPKEVTAEFNFPKVNKHPNTCITAVFLNANVEGSD